MLKSVGGHDARRLASTPVHGASRPSPTVRGSNHGPRAVHISAARRDQGGQTVAAASVNIARIEIDTAGKFDTKEDARGAYLAARGQALHISDEQRNDK